MRRVALTALAVATIAGGRPDAQAPGGGAIAPPLSPRNASYSIDARLDAPSRTITGSEVITWRNITTKPASELQFHLYWNAWRNDQLDLAGASAPCQRRPRPRHAARTTGRASTSARFDCSAPVPCVGGADLKPIDLAQAKRFIAPDDDNPNDETVMAVPLPQPIAAGRHASTIEVAWTAHVPRTFARTGAIGNFFFIAQWFPKLGVLQDDGWNCHQFHAGTEFFSDYGVYDVSLTVPAGWPSAPPASSASVATTPTAPTTHRYYQEDVHDFAWTTSPDYLERTARFEHPRLPPVEMRLLLQPEHAARPSATSTRRARR